MSILGGLLLDKSYGNRCVLDGISLALAASQRAGLVGRNGTGKSTLARILAKVESPDAGEVVWAKGIRVLYLEQEPTFEPGQTALGAVLSGKADWLAAQARYERASAALASGGADSKWLEEQTQAAAAIEELGGWTVQHEAEAMLARLHIDDVAAPVDRLSGGQRRRVALARVFVAAPDLVILDEPTNHLDIESIEWLESYLVQSFRGAALLVTHDRYLLDRVVDTTYELSAGGLFSVDGGWEAYLEAKAERAAHDARVESNRQNFLRRELEWLRRQPKARTTKSKARVERAQEALGQKRGPQDKTADMQLGNLRSGKTVLELDDLSVARGDNVLIHGLTLRLAAGQRVGIVGPNGCGKSSLLACILGELEPMAGRVTHGKNTVVAHLDQARGGLDDRATVYDAVAQGQTMVRHGGNETAIRVYLERFLFDSASQRQLVGSLSGGERGRVALAKVLRDESNLLILDEPTNDLDVDTLAALEEALLEFPGTLLTVTHDRWFLDRVATHILAIEPGGRVDLITGNYSDYVAQRASGSSATPVPKPTASVAKANAQTTSSPASRTKLTYAEKLELDKLLPRIEVAEQRVAQLARELELPEFYRRPIDDQREVQAAFAAASSEVETLVARWEALESRRESS